ncbi:hypothetical protein C8J55DRAFT_428233 [Lentinula edodes]|uniref:rRNA-processing protein FYV7 n=1 Tax=Lentinula lateritia TaxID=40482 RepID=A0A9W9AH69_9AGAR|nr:hypothetical protein C8J55DRAFT_428233 [Lentinula edodes]
MVISAAEVHKKKKPPSFNHYPEAKAKSLKKAWVEKTKIKSKWRAERRKMGLPSRSLPTQNVDAQKEKQNDMADSEAEEDKESESADETVTTPELPMKLQRRPPRPNFSSTSQSKQPKEQLKEHETPDLRELTRKAYSRETLHTYKSDPLNRRGGINGGKRHSRGGNRGRGQPDMKLRMGVMLEKIKRDFI